MGRIELPNKEWIRTSKKCSHDIDRSNYKFYLEIYRKLKGGTNSEVGKNSSIGKNPKGHFSRRLTLTITIINCNDDDCILMMMIVYS